MCELLQRAVGIFAISRSSDANHINISITVAVAKVIRYNFTASLEIDMIFCEHHNLF